jgi:hypothetical protein
MIFMPVLLGAKIPGNLGMIMEYYDQAGPLCINGYPMFLSCRLVNKKDAKKIWSMVEKLKKAEAVALGENDG